MNDALTPGFHHLHLNSVDPDAAVDFYTRSSRPPRRRAGAACPRSRRRTTSWCCSPDHIALGVADLDAWVAKLRGEGVTFLEEPYKLGDTRAVMIEGPSREALELVEVA